MTIQPSGIRQDEATKLDMNTLLLATSAFSSSDGERVAIRPGEGRFMGSYLFLLDLLTHPEPGSLAGVREVERADRGSVSRSPLAWVFHTRERACGGSGFQPISIGPNRRGPREFSRRAGNRRDARNAEGDSRFVFSASIASLRFTWPLPWVAALPRCAVSRVSNPSARSTVRTPCRLEVGDTAGLETRATDRRFMQTGKVSLSLSRSGHAQSENTRPSTLLFPVRGLGQRERPALTLTKTHPILL